MVFDTTLLAGCTTKECNKDELFPACRVFEAFLTDLVPHQEHVKDVLSFHMACMDYDQITGPEPSFKH